jgi:hypothetical protein
MLNVHFINRGYGTDNGFINVELKELKVCEFTQAPEAIIENPYWKGDTLRARFEDGEWVCDLD